MSQQGFWNDDWMQIQRKYWENWTEMSQKAMGSMPGVSQTTPWENAMEHWWKAFAPTAPDTASDFMSKMMNQGRTFFNMAEQFSGTMQGNGGMAEWTEVLNKTFTDMQNTFLNAGQGQGDDAMQKMMAYWEMPLDNWQRMVSSLSLTPGDALRNMQHAAPQEHLERFLSAPGLGYTREEQGQYQDMMLAGVEYQKNLQEYMMFFSNTGALSVDRMRQNLEQLAKDGKSITTARGLFDAWVAACEEVYSEQVMTPEYLQLHGKLVNSLMRVKRQMMNLVEEGCSALNMPTNSELRTLQNRMQENRREIRALKREVNQLKAMLAEKAPAPKRKAAPKKKAAVKK
ncbi:MAG: class III poly(R)-hydroxyalkanoic acid synthase subunit PhaE [Chromatiales bacterium]|nr:class III poly(R)-hydroxyalkanoic acid synthase subunit PhaE [Chromatiales bacterium]